MGDSAVMDLPTKCAFCGKDKAETKRLMTGIAVNSNADTFQSCICSECLGLQMHALATFDRSHFEELVEAARSGNTLQENSN